jgi:hypothetical protein
MVVYLDTLHQAATCFGCMPPSSLSRPLTYPLWLASVGPRAEALTVLTLTTRPAAMRGHRSQWQPASDETTGE